MDTVTRIPLTRPEATASVTPFGAHVLSFDPTGDRPLLRLSKRAILDGSTAIRGGIPLCLPWFGNPAFSSASHKGATASHGFARTSTWDEVARTESTCSFELVHRRADLDGVFPHDLRVRLDIAVSESLDMELTLINEDDHEYRVDAALHPYVAVGDVRRVSVDGLDGASTSDGFTGGRGRIEGSLRFEGPTDLVCSSSSDLTIDDAEWNRRIRITKTNSASTIVWNPWAEHSREMRDMGPDEWPGFVCVECGNVREAAVGLPAGATHTMTMSLSVEAL